MHLNIKMTIAAYESDKILITHDILKLAKPKTQE